MIIGKRLTTQCAADSQNILGHQIVTVGHKNLLSASLDQLQWSHRRLEAHPPKKIVLKQSQIALAKRLGLTAEQYAREYAKTLGN